MLKQVIIKTWGIFEKVISVPFKFFFIEYLLPVKIKLIDIESNCLNNINKCAKTLKYHLN